MAFDCKNKIVEQTCGNFVPQYIGNMEFVSERLLDVINQHILLGVEEGHNDITDVNCVCLPLDPTGKSRVFDCTIWATIKDLLIDVSEENENSGYLTLLCQTIRCFLNQTEKINHGFAAQMERFLCLVESLATRLDSVCCNNKCPELIGDLLCLLMQILTKLISSVSKAALLMYYNDCDTNAIDGNRVVSSFFECMACDFVNDLAELEKLIPEVSAIVVGFATCDMQQCTPCYTAPSVPRKVRPMCPTNMTGYPYGRQGGCSCNCKK